MTSFEMVNLQIEKPFIRFLNQNLARRTAKFVFKFFIRIVFVATIMNIFFWKELEHITSSERADFVLQRDNFIWTKSFFFGDSCWMKNGWRAIHFAQILFVRIWGLVRVNFCLNREKLEGRVKERKYEEWNALKINSLINIIARFFFQHIKNIYFKCYHKILNIF